MQMSFFFAYYKYKSLICWCNIIDILMTNISVYKWNKTCFSLHDYLPWTIFQKNCIISLIRNAMKHNWYFLNTLLSYEFFLFFVRYRIRSPEVNIQLLLCDFYYLPWITLYWKINLIKEGHVTSHFTGLNE